MDGVIVQFSIVDFFWNYSCNGPATRYIAEDGGGGGGTNERTYHHQ